MHQTRLPLSIVFKSGVLALLLVGCTAESRKLQHLSRAEQYLKAEELEKAKIEYLNVLRADRQNASAYRGLGLIWFEQGSPIQACGYLLRARELTPSDFDVRTKLSKALLSIGQVVSARKEAIALADDAPNDSEALVIIADTARTQEEIEETQQRLDGHPRKDSAFFHLASANLDFRKRDLGGAEAALQLALQTDPKSSMAHSMFASLLLMQDKVPQATEELKLAAKLAPPRSAERLRYAEFLRQSGRRDEAKRLLQDLAGQTPDYLPVVRARARVALDEKNPDEASTYLKALFQIDPQDFEGRLIEAGLWLEKGDAKRSIALLENVDKTFPNIPAVKFQLGRAQLQDKNAEGAGASLSAAIAGNPDYVEAILLLAELNLRSGDAQSAITALTRLLERQPKLEPAQRLLAEAFRASGRLEDAASIFRAQAEAKPDDAGAHFFLGTVLRQQGKGEQARAAFAKSAELAPDNPGPIEQLVEMDIGDRRFDRAGDRVQQELEKHSGSAAAHFLQGKLSAAQADWDRAESELSKAIEIDPQISAAYNVLVASYLRAGKLPQAAVQLERKILKDPTDQGSLGLLGMIYSASADYDKARAAYEKLLAVKTDSVLALNNLAYLYSERFDQLDKAHEYALKARTTNPLDPNVADTLGWILCKRGDFPQASALLAESVAKMPESAEVQHHWGVVSYKKGDLPAARTAFAKVVDSPGQFAGKEAAQRYLARLDLTAEGARQLSVSELDAMLKDQPDDIVVMVRLAEALEKEGAFQGSADTLAKAITINPRMAEAHAKLARLYSGPLADPVKAMESAKKAQALAPNDAKIAATLGKIALQAGDDYWAYSLLQESARQPSVSPDILRDLASAAYLAGKSDSSRQALQNLLKATSAGPLADDARASLAMIALEESGQTLPAEEPKIKEVLQKNPNDVPALMVRAALEVRRGEIEPAAHAYEAVLKQHPQFARAQKHLAKLYLANPKTRQKAHDLALRARKALTDDSELAETLGQSSFHRNDYAGAIRFLQESGNKRPLSAISLFYLGLAQIHEKRPAVAQESIRKALAAGLSDPQASEATERLAELESQ